MKKNLCLLICAAACLTWACSEDSSASSSTSCKYGQHLDESGVCVDVEDDAAKCPDGEYFEESAGICVKFESTQCKEDEIFDAEKEKCIKKDTKNCLENQYFDDERQECVDNIEAPSDCPEDYHFDVDENKCVYDDSGDCPDGQHLDNGICIDDIPKCKEGQHLDENNKCIDDAPKCKEGQHLDENNKCIDDAPKCKEGQHLDENNKCIDDAPKCKEGQHLDETLNKCIPTCLFGYLYDSKSDKCVYDDPYPTLTKTQKHQKAIQETAMAYYRRGSNVQYESYRRSVYNSPETITSQKLSYLVCSGFTYAVYYNALGIQLPDGTNKYNAYGHSHHQDDKTIIKYLEGDALTAAFKDDATATKTVKSLLPKLDVADLISYYQKEGDTSAGHVILVYDFIRDGAGNKTDAVILHSTSNFEKSAYKSTKLTKSLSWNHTLNSLTGVHEGTVQRTLLSKLLTSNTKKYTQFVVWRPLQNDTKYTHVTYTGHNMDKYPDWDDKAKITQNSYALTESAKSRLQFSGIEIEKTVDIHDGSTVVPGDKLNYTIQITNHSDAAYPSLKITQTVSANVDISKNSNAVVSKDKSGNHILTWTIPSIKSQQTQKIEFTAVVRSDAEFGKSVTTDGFIANISSGKTENLIAKGLTSDQVKKLKTSYASRIKDGKQKGLALIEAVYKDALNVTLGLDKAKYYVLYATSTNSDATKKNLEKYSPYYSASKVDSLLSAYYKNVPTSLVLEPKSPLANIVFNHYYSSVFSSVSSTGTLNSSGPVIYENSTNAPDSRSDRQNMIYPATLRDGDILIYGNAKDSITKEPDGTYAFILLDGIFKGINEYKGADGKVVKVNEVAIKDGVHPGTVPETDKAKRENMTKRYGLLPTMYGKDFFVVLRPALKINK